jgi:hypothetical protein
MESLNPYESPHAEDKPLSPKAAETQAHGGWMASLSLILILLSIMPTIDLLVIGRLIGAESLSLFFVSAFGLALPLLPLVIFLCIYGQRGLKAAKGRILAIAIITGFIVIVNMCSIFM